MGISTATELIILNPSIFGDKSIHNLLHGQVWDELVLGQFLTRHRVKVTNPLWIESYTTRSPAGDKRKPHVTTSCQCTNIFSNRSLTCLQVSCIVKSRS